MGSYDEYGRRAPWVDPPGTHNQTRPADPSKPITEPCALCGRLALGGYPACCGRDLADIPPRVAILLSTIGAALVTDADLLRADFPTIAKSRDDLAAQIARMLTDRTAALLGKEGGK